MQLKAKCLPISERFSILKKDVPMETDKLAHFAYLKTII